MSRESGSRSQSKSTQAGVTRVLRSQAEKQRSREAGQQTTAEKQERTAEKQGSQKEGSKSKMQEERWENLTGNPLKAKHIQELWDYWRETRPDYPQFLKDTVPAIMNFSGNLTVIKASALAVTVWEKFQKTDEASKVHSTFSKLSLSEFGMCL